LGEGKRERRPNYDVSRSFKLQDTFSVLTFVLNVPDISMQLMFAELPGVLKNFATKAKTTGFPF
jgi:hypothetical protein